jgi:hypothetical protein
MTTYCRLSADRGATRRTGAGWAIRAGRVPVRYGAALLLAALCWPGSAAAKGVVFPAGPVAPLPAIPPQFDITGFIQSATLDRAGKICTPSDPRLAGGTVTLNGITVIIPCNTILQMPATSLTWTELFTLAPSGTPPGTTGLALTDPIPLPAVPAGTPKYNGALPSYEIRIQGNVVNGRYIAGLVFISQQKANVGQGVINFINYANGEIHVGGTPGVSRATDARVRLNDPVGRFGKSHGPVGSTAQVQETGYDARFTADTDNPTVRSQTGYPMCVPCTDPFVGGDDPQCPQGNRPISPGCQSLPAPFPAFNLPPAGQYCTSFVMGPPPVPAVPATGCTALPCPTDPTKQTPFEVGDYISYEGTLKIDPVTGPYISAHTVIGHLGIYTTPGVQPSYVAIDVLEHGTSELVSNFNVPVLPLVEGFSTDPSMLVDIYAVDVDPATGAATNRYWSTEDPSAPPVVGRFLFSPNAGNFAPPSREIRVVSRNACADNSVPCQAPAAPLVANRLRPGQYKAPNFNFIFPAALVPGDPVVASDFQDLPFLFCGSGPLATPSVRPGSTGPVVGQLNPAPWAAPMPAPAFASTLCPNAPLP